jgi:hypothetical protein
MWGTHSTGAPRIVGPIATLKSTRSIGWLMSHLKASGIAFILRIVTRQNKSLSSGVVKISFSVFRSFLDFRLETSFNETKSSSNFVGVCD